ncbi:uncharacterized protein LOC126981397 [Eriocheir sinensis]|uniref:uncharacterized protein LOC126981397 n=1 Tax=Eriocheir sinensis TaxID=95602 RepID=UPI0021CAA623|nr:uncharacterized protein LOC126981397 [Eriocheir sinensis]
MPLYFTERPVKESPQCVLRLPRTRSAPEEVIHTSYWAVKAELLTRYRISRKDQPPGKDEDEKEPAEGVKKEEEEEKKREKERSLRIRKEKKKKEEKKTQKKTIYDETDEEEEEKNKKKAIMKTLRQRKRNKTKKRTPTTQEIHVKCRGKRPFYMILRECMVRGKGMTLADLSLALHLQKWEVTEPEESLADPSVMDVKCAGMKDFEVQKKKKENIVEM